MRILFIFLDGVGLGTDDPATNPLARATMPALSHLLEGHKLIASAAPFIGRRASLFALDASLGVPGLPQSATGQAALLTGLNVPEQVGEHYGPKPNPPVAKLLAADNLFIQLRRAGRSAALLNAYPPRYFDGVDSGRRLYSSIPLAVTAAGNRLFNQDDLFLGKAISADFTGEGWANMLGIRETPILEPRASGFRLAQLAREYDFSLFEYWASDYAGHKQDMPWALRQLDVLDDVLKGLVNEADEETLVLVTSDHGNMEDLSTRRHTLAPVPALLIGSQSARRTFGHGLGDIAGVTPAILRVLQVPAS
ncbi:MAG TPA: alkaline phosphatase family protein [Anaerolineales bacterium]